MDSLTTYKFSATALLHGTMNGIIVRYVKTVLPQHLSYVCCSLVSLLH